MAQWINNCVLSNNLLCHGLILGNNRVDGRTTGAKNTASALKDCHCYKYSDSVVRSLKHCSSFKKKVSHPLDTFTREMSSSKTVSPGESVRLERVSSDFCQFYFLLHFHRHDKELKLVISLSSFLTSLFVTQSPPLDYYVWSSSMSQT